MPCRLEYNSHQLVSVQLLSCVHLCSMPWTEAHQVSLSITNSQSLPKLMSTELVMASNHIILCCPLLPHSIFPSIRVFSNESVLCIRWPEYWSFSFSISPSSEYSELISFRRYWLALLAVQGTLKSLLPTPQFKSTNSVALLSTSHLSGMKAPLFLVRGRACCRVCGILVP